MPGCRSGGFQTPHIFMQRGGWTPPLRGIGYLFSTRFSESVPCGGIARRIQSFPQLPASKLKPMPRNGRKQKTRNDPQTQTFSGPLFGRM